MTEPHKEPPLMPHPDAYPEGENVRSEINLASRSTRFCWWLSRRLSGRRVFGKRDLS